MKAKTEEVPCKLKRGRGSVTVNELSNSRFLPPPSFVKKRLEKTKGVKEKTFLTLSLLFVASAITQPHPSLFFLILLFYPKNHCAEIIFNRKRVKLYSGKSKERDEKKDETGV